MKVTDIKKISFEKQKEIQLEMLKEIDYFCKHNSIRYSLAFGTLLGAIRHKGYIPWDDDVDIMMPYPDLIKLKRLFSSETLKYCDVDNEPNYIFPFSRIVHTRTINKVGLLNSSYGICIDIYPIISLPNSKEEQLVFFEKANELQRKRLMLIKLRSRLIKFLPMKLLPSFSKVMKSYRDFVLFSNDYHENEGQYYIIAGPLPIRDKMIYSVDLFNNTEEAEFEGSYFPIIREYDYFLHLRYNNYMELPPESERQPYHGGCYYWK